MEIDKVIDEAKAAVLPFESWVRTAGESGLAYAAFCSFRDLGPERTMRKAVENYEKDEAKRNKRYRVWCNWAALYKWRERAGDYDSYLDKLKQAEQRKTIEAQGELHRATTEKMLQVALKKMDIMNPDDLTQTSLNEWVNTAIRADREGAALIAGKTGENGKQGQMTFGPEFEGL